MILYLPEIYEDETMFSYLSRAYEKGGYISQIQALGEFLKNPNIVVQLSRQKSKLFIMN